MAGVIDTVLFGLVRDYFKSYLPKQRSCSPHTIRSYQNTLEALFDFVKSEKGVELYQLAFDMIDSKMIVAFLDDMSKKGNSDSTINQRLRCIRSFYSYAAQMEQTAVIHHNEILKVPAKKTAKSDIIDYMSEKAIKTLLEQPDVTTKKGLRDQFIMLLMYDAAARVQEIVDIRLCDIRLGKTPTVILHGKGSKIRTVPLMKQTVEHYFNYVGVYHKDEDIYSEQSLFYSVCRNEKLRLDSSTIRKMISGYGKSAKEKCPEVLDNVHPHILRHSRAMHLYQHGMDLTLISQWLGHAQLETTLIYAHADTEQKRLAIEKATTTANPLKKKSDLKRFTITDEEVLKKLYGLVGG